MKFERSSGLILHPSSLPGPYGIGDLGPEAYRWIDQLAKTGCRLWQILPLGPTGYGDSPYQCFSTFAGNPYLISPELMLEEKLLLPGDIVERPIFPVDRVDFGPVIQWKLYVLNKAYDRFASSASAALKAEFDAFRQEQASWLEDYALFMAIKEAHGGAPWITWEPPLRDRLHKELEAFCQEHWVDIQRQLFRQFLFYRQWAAIRHRAKARNILIVGDIPIYVAHDSADVWAHPELFFLDKTGKPTVVAGVPPDYFSPTGQLWGNPIYRWDVHASTGYAWWLARLRATLALVDIVRLDHFRGFAGYWEVPANAKTAKEGHWVKGPGAPFFNAVRTALGELPIIAEDLGEITPDVFELRDQFELPGMKVILFGFGGKPEDTFLPHNYTSNYVAYTGTHDNDTVRGWYLRVEEEERDFYRRYIGRDGSDVAWDMIRAVWSSVAIFALAPVQDLLSLDNRARMNYPGNPSGNWSWRLPPGGLSDHLGKRLKEFNFLYGRQKAETKAVTRELPPQEA